MLDLEDVALSFFSGEATGLWCKQKITSTRSWRAQFLCKALCIFTVSTSGMKAVKQLDPKKVTEISKKKLHELFLCLIAVSGILTGSTMMNKQSKWSKLLCNEPCVNCPTVHWNTKGTNEAHSLIIPWLTSVRPLSTSYVSRRNCGIQGTPVKGLISHLEMKCPSPGPDPKQATSARLTC